MRGLGRGCLGGIGCLQVVRHSWRQRMVRCLMSYIIGIVLVPSTIFSGMVGLWVQRRAGMHLSVGPGIPHAGGVTMCVPSGVRSVWGMKFASMCSSIAAMHRYSPSSTMSRRRSLAWTVCSQGSTKCA